MPPLYSRSSYFSTRSHLKEREKELLQNLKEKLPPSSVGEDLFEYLVVRIELERTRLSKELDAGTQGRIKELSELLDIFAVQKN